MDDVVYNAPYLLPFKAAGNDRNDPAPSNGTTFYYYVNNTWQPAVYNSSTYPLGDGVVDGGYDTILPGSCAKNIMTVGAVGDAVSGGKRYLGGASMESYSAWGPADDGRIKPDIAANGSSLYSTYSSSDSSYATMSGTSMATPNACGSAALLVDYYYRRMGTYMRASTLKGLIIHTADDLGRPGPDYSYGWGLMNTLAAASLINDYANGDTLRMTEATLSSGGYGDYYEIDSDGYEPIRVTLCWTDPPGNPMTGLDDPTPSLVNDLDIMIYGPDGNYYPYSLDPSHPTANATATGPNHVDNVEQIYIKTPLPGPYLVYINYSGTLTGGQQDYSLLVSGDGYDSDGDGMSDYWELANFNSATGAVATADADGDGEDNYNEYVSGTDPNNPASVFKTSSYSVPSASGQRFIINWNPIFGRVYNVVGAPDLLSGSYSDLSGDLPYPVDSYTTTVQNAVQQQYYRVNVRLN